MWAQFLRWNCFQCSIVAWYHQSVWISSMWYTCYAHLKIYRQHWSYCISNRVHGTYLRAIDHVKWIQLRTFKISNWKWEIFLCIKTFFKISIILKNILSRAICFLLSMQRKIIFAPIIISLIFQYTCWNSCEKLREKYGFIQRKKNNMYFTAYSVHVVINLWV